MTCSKDEIDITVRHDRPRAAAKSAARVSPIHTEGGIHMKTRLIQIDVEKIIPNPNQPRRIFSPDELAALSLSISENGLLQPITVRRHGLNFELVAGERRLRAAKQCGMRTIPCILTETTDEQSCVLALVENIQRADLTFFEEAEAILRLIEVYGLRQEEIASRLSKKQSTIANKLRLLKLTRLERERILSSGLTERHARALLKLENEEERLHALDHIISHRLKVEATERYVERMMQQPVKRRRGVTIVKDMRIVLNTLDRALDSIVTAGIAAKASHEDAGDCIIYTVRIPKREGVTA